jgi:hypothetical protein
MIVYSDRLGWLKLHEVAEDTKGGEANGHAVVNRRDLFATIYAGDLPEGEHFQWWHEHVMNSLAGLKGAVKSHGVLRKGPNDDIIGVVWAKAPGKTVEKDPPKLILLRVLYCIQMVQIIQAMMKRGLFYTDIKSNNVFRDFWNRPTFIDLLSVSTTKEIEFPDGVKKSRQFVKGMPETYAPELAAAPIDQRVNSESTLAHTVAVMVYAILKDDYPSTIHDAQGHELPWDEIERQRLYGRFGTVPDGMTVPDKGAKWAEMHEMTQYTLNQFFLRGRLNPAVRPSIDELLDALVGWRNEELKRAGMFAAAWFMSICMVLMWMGMLEPAPTKKTQEAPPRVRMPSTQLWER